MISKSPESMTAEEFAEQKYDLPEGGRWTELVSGQVVTLSPPDDLHGNFVRNLSAALAGYAQESDQGYACFELGLIVSRGPDTVRCPPACYFLTGERFAEQDKVATELQPALVVEIASTNDRRRGMAARVEDYFRWGVPLVWIADPHSRQVHVCVRGQPRKVLEEHQTLFGGSILSGFRSPVAALFVEPDWWK